jgi:hypothetical protein
MNGIILKQCSKCGIVGLSPYSEDQVICASCGIISEFNEPSNKYIELFAQQMLEDNEVNLIVRNLTLAGADESDILHILGMRRKDVDSWYIDHEINSLIRRLRETKASFTPEAQARISKMLNDENDEKYAKMIHGISLKNDSDSDSDFDYESESPDYAMFAREQAQPVAKSRRLENNNTLYNESTDHIETSSNVYNYPVNPDDYDENEENEENMYLDEYVENLEDSESDFDTEMELEFQDLNLTSN